MMDSGDIVVVTAIACGMVLGIIAVVAWTIVSLVTGRRRPQNINDDDAKIIQEIYHGLTKMEQRVESLETLLLEREKRG